MKTLILSLKHIFTPHEVATAVPGNLLGWLHSFSLGTMVSLSTIVWFLSKTVLLWWDRIKKRPTKEDPNG